MMAHIPDHPVIRNLERTGHPGGAEPPAPICPVCGEEMEVLYLDRDGDYAGCDCCIKEVRVCEVDWRTI